LSLFSGAGGLDIGFSDAGFDIVESVEIEEKFCETLEMNSGTGKRFNNSKVCCIDIRKFSARDLGTIDFIIGGPPCQTFSAAGRRANGVLGTTDARGVLFREYVRLLQELSPRGFLFENVYGITGAQNGEAWREIQDAFRESGYKLFFRILDAADYGVPQHRERLIIVGLKSGQFRFPRPTHGPDSLDKTPFYNAGTAVNGVSLTEEEAKPGLGGRFGHLLPAIPPGLNYSFYTEKLGHPKPLFAWRSKFSDFLYKADPTAPVRTIKASGGAYTGPLHWDNRFFSLGEYKRLQTFPDDYAISGGKQVAVKQIGNSVPPQLARMLAASIQQQLFHARLPFQLDLLEQGEVLSFRKRKNELTREFRGKAKKAIALEKHEGPRPLEAVSYECTLSDEFLFQKTAPGTGDFTVSFKPETGISVRDAHSRTSSKMMPAMRIRVAPSEKGWSLAIDHMDIVVFSDSNQAFTIGWKAFEQLLADSSLKADLVQLNGYYQYEPKLHCSCVFSGPFPFKSIVSSIVEGRNVAHLASTAQLAAAWDVPTETVWDVAEFLRSLGYEVRNPNTNPQIPPDHWLVPYAFPTFTQRSVQLRKKLR
jgi:DNA (cytosine-5)-methyltransferase 1